MCLDAARGAERILAVLKWDLAKQRLATPPASPDDKDKGEPHVGPQCFTYDACINEAHWTSPDINDVASGRGDLLC